MDEIPEPIRVAVSRLSGVVGLTLESSPEFIPAESAWAVRLCLATVRPSEFVPTDTRWVALVDGSYPAGRIRIFPAQSGGLIHTFPHQDRNVASRLIHATWRTGKPCLDSPSPSLGRIAADPEPKGDVEQRLRWHVERCLAWLEVAALEQLKIKGDPFETPQCPLELLDTQLTVIHDEGDDTWRAWGGRVGRFGEIHWGVLPGFEKTILAEEFLDARSERIRVCRRGRAASENPWVGYWWLWPAPIVIPPWHAPGTWGDLRRTGERLKVDVDAFIGWMARRAGGKKAVIVLLGYPIPTRWNSAPVEVHWQAILPPEVPEKIKPMRGFRANERGRMEVLRGHTFGGSKTLSYLKTVNWHPDRLQARGRLPLAVRERSVAVVGAGALGSAVAELLVRGGVTNLLIIDHDDLEAGNLVRHTLTGTHLGQNKATAVAARLQGAAPMSRITALAKPLPQGDELQKLLEPFDVVLDLTGDDDVLRRLGAGWRPIPQLFLSVSLGFAATRLFLFEARACHFPFEEFNEAVRPWLKRERAHWTEAGETLEGAGCWSPLFPARSDDVWLAAVATIKHLERTAGGEARPGLQVMEQRGGGVVGFHPVAPEEEE